VISIKIRHDKPLGSDLQQNHMVIEMLLEFMKQSVLGRAWSHRIVALASATRGLNQVV